MIAYLFNNKKRYPLTVAVRIARREYAAQPHTQGHPPALVIFNPASCPPESVIDGLSVYTHPDVPVYCIRIAAVPGEVRQ